MGRPLSQPLLKCSLQVWGLAVYYCQSFYIGDASETEIPLEVIDPCVLLT